jgi:hypothetical protein
MTRRSFSGSFLRTLAGAAGAGALRGQTAAQTKGREIADKAVYAIGGDGFRFMKTRTEIGKAYSFYNDKITGLSPAHIYTNYLPSGTTGTPVLIQQRQVFGKKEDDAVLLTGTEAWEVNFRGARNLGEERLKTFLDTTLHDIFYILRCRLDEPGMTFEHIGQDVVENSPVETLDIYDSENRKTTVWIHSSTFLPVKQRFDHWDPVVSARRAEVTRYTKYREAGNGVTWPHDTQRERDGEKILELYADKVIVGAEFKPGMFDLPQGVTVLKK